MEGRKRKKRSKISPSQWNVNSSFELEMRSDATPSKKGSVHNSDFEAKKENFVNAIIAIAEAKQIASKWKNWNTSKRIKKKNDTRDEEVEEMEKKYGLDDIHDDFSRPTTVRNGTVSKSMSAASNRALIEYFAKLGHSKKEDEVIDLDFVDTLLENGADIQCTDRHGQTLLHEVARKWHVDVAKFLIFKRADVNAKDIKGRTPLHVAAADNYPEMVQLLIDSGADKEAVTEGEKQTAMHYAAKNDACNSMKMLINMGCDYKNVCDFKGRTPLHIAAQLDRSESAMFLLNLDAPVKTSDNKGQTVLSWMITKMPPVALEGLKQFHTTDRPNRKQYFHLNCLVEDIEKDGEGNVITPLKAAVKYRQYDLLTKPVFVVLLDRMWMKFARWRTVLNLILNMLYILLWTVMAVTVEYDQRYIYYLPDQWWRIVILVGAVIFTFWQVIEEFNEFRKSKRSHNMMIKQRTEEIMQDMEYCHPRCPDEKAFLQMELDDLQDTHESYFSDYWNIFDWICYVFLLTSLATHIADIISHSDALARAHIRIMAVNIILLWVRLMKAVRAFKFLGPFIVIMTKILGDLVKIGFLYLVFYCPYVCAFWMIFGGTKFPEGEAGNPNRTEVTVGGMGTFNDALFSMFRMTLVDGYDYDTMKEVDYVMSNILVGSWLFISAILVLNLFIALLSDTFQRVYDNAKSIASMQRAITILAFWEGMNQNAQKKFLEEIKQDCSPLVKYYDDDMTQDDDENIKKLTMQIKEDLEDLKTSWQNKFGKDKDMDELKGQEDSDSDDDNDSQGGGGGDNHGKKAVTIKNIAKEVDSLKDSIKELKKKQDDIKYLLTDLVVRLERGNGVSYYGSTVGAGYQSHMGYMNPYVQDDRPERLDSKPEAGKKKKEKRMKATKGSLLEYSEHDISQQTGQAVRPITRPVMLEIETTEFSPSSVPPVTMSSDQFYVSASRNSMGTGGNDHFSEC
ncbi:hypothetical protein CHS0354_002574 [Potamilus streckersoni]|uniref:Ion transport domain-containing protein n=1 Tax=Potamilus streckersoni TaxID=2493646 RepID=A0AAE0RNJ3_9BIVA|nr:hypothetical protein CHS0354_002574 [Potamilus streckersoni]